MTCGVRHVGSLAVSLALIAGTSVLAQQAQTPPPPSGQPRAIPQERTPPPGREQYRSPQGFSVVLVVADLQASSAADDVPPAARRALVDMKDFLPYKSYRLVDAAWILGQGTSGTSTRLRGPEEQDYELQLHTSRSESSRVSVRFSLRDAGSSESVTEVATTAESRRERDQALAEIQRLQEKLVEARKNNQEAQVRDLRAQIEALDRKREALDRQRRPSTTVQQKLTPRAARTLIDTSFTMEIGETVVVGTSRLKANSKALIALLTAVPAKGTKLTTEIR